MVRLIDADAIEHCLVVGGRRHGKTIISEIIRRAIQTAPTVDAVPVIRCKDCGQREYGCSTFIDHNQIYGFCAWAWKAERKEE